MGRAPCCEKIGLKKGRWAAEEDEKLTKYIQQHGEGCWRSLPRNAGLLRCGKSCRLRWINYLRADLKRGNITPAEEETIVKLQRSLGNRWSVIATHLPGRTDNEIKNYWNSHLSRRIYRFRKFMNSCTPTDIDLINVAEVRRPKGRRLRSTSITKKDNSKPMTFMSTDRMPEKNGANETDDRSKEKEKEDMGINNNLGHEENRELMLLENWDLLNCNNGVNSEECSCCSSDINVGGEVLGPYEWLDSEIERLNGILQKESCGDDNDVEEGKTSGVMGISEERGEKEGFVQLLARDFGSDEKNKITSSRVVENDYDLVRGLSKVEDTLTRSSRTGKDYSRFENGEETLCSVSSTTCDSSSMNSHGFDFDEEWIEWDLGGVGGSSICDGSGFGFYCNDNEELGF